MANKVAEKTAIDFSCVSRIAKWYKQNIEKNPASAKGSRAAKVLFPRKFNEIDWR